MEQALADVRPKCNNSYERGDSGGSTKTITRRMSILSATEKTILFQKMKESQLMQRSRTACYCATLAPQQQQKRRELFSRRAIVIGLHGKLHAEEFSMYSALCCDVRPTAARLRVYPNGYTTASRH